MERFEKSSLWRSTLAPQDEDDDLTSKKREELRQAYYQLRSRISDLVKDIPSDIKGFTIHDETHLDALWDLASIIAGPDYKFTPAEGFVMGGAILIHDAGMALMAHPLGRAELRTDEKWLDTLALLWRNKTGNYATSADLSPGGIATKDAELTQQADAEVLRSRHAQRAEDLLFKTWTLNSGESYSLLDNKSLKENYGWLIGQIAGSHWWPIDELPRKFNKKRGAPGEFPQTWTVDPLVLACLLRTADAAHLDERRAPKFLQALRKPHGVSKQHWEFQSRLLQPILLPSNLLQFSSSSPFPVSENASWWLAYEALNIVDQELRSVDALITESGRVRFEARGVGHVSSPTYLSQTVEASGWSPVDTRVRVGDAVKLALTLGGRQLYGAGKLVPLRELIQNASDAVRARRLLQRRPENWGDVTIKLSPPSPGVDDWLLEVEDNGIGMSEAVLRGPFLDFGASFWGSWASLDEHPSLSTLGFQSVGGFGIGFYSVFMWASRVCVRTRHYESAAEATLVLEFQNGLNTNPLLRQAERD
ncbi:MAG: ATP-binding protein, partial [Cytophagaceae bacterium]